MIEKKRLCAGFVINPYAGIGGEAALKGSDGIEVRSQALAYSSVLRAPARAGRFLKALGEHSRCIDWYCGNGLMGETVLLEHGVPALQLTVVNDAGGGAGNLSGDMPTSAEDTQAVARLFHQHGVDLVLFAGGDGTARDIFDVIGLEIPVLGIPAGVKMQSGVFALTPEAAAEIVKSVIDADLLTVADQDVRDIDEQALREGRVCSRYYGSMRVPAAPCYLQHLKQGSVEDEAAVLDELAAHLTEIMREQKRLMLVGPGRTLAYWMGSLGLENTLVGFDAILDGKLVQADLNARAILQLQQQYPDLLLVISPTGNQGALLGRGNQQLSPEFIRQLRKEQWLIVATKQKLGAYNHKPLIVDTNDPELDARLCGLYPVVASWHHEVLYPVNVTYMKLT